jgi:uncharacterized membrane protein YdbT with pleckstrin-like domain
VPTIFDGSTQKKTPAAAAPVKGKMMAPLSSYAELPRGVRFETQEKEETVELFLRQHPIVNIPWIALAAFLLLIPSFFPYILQAVKLPISLPLNYMFVAGVFWYVATFGFILTNLMHWFFNIYIVTDERLVDIDFYFLLYKHFSEAELSKIQDISYTSSGILPTLLNYGNVTIQTASELPTLDFEMVPHPEKIVEKIRELSERIKK